MSNLIMQRILSGTVVKPDASATKENPFLKPLGHTVNNWKPNQEVGVNQPLRHPMFVGYKDNKAVYAGSRLFVLY